MKENYSISQRLALLIASLFGPTLIRLSGITWRVKYEGTEELARARQGGNPVLFCFWHSRLLGLCYTHRYRNIGIMVSKSFDGEWISRIVTRLGYRVFRGSASRGGAAALLEMIKEKSGDLALTVDGPRGPAEKVKPGILTLAVHTGLPLVPIGYSATRVWRLKSWDKFMVPKPFSTVTVRYGPAIPLPREITNENMAATILEIENGINRVSDQC